MKRIISILFFAVFLLKVTAQAPAKELDFFPLSPEASELLRFDDFPASNFTGIPDISIPIYNINVDNLTIPINLRYHAGGIRVNQEASKVGLGWSINDASIVQIINDEDDYGLLNSGNNVTRKMADWRDIPMVTMLPYRFNYPWIGDDGLGWSTPWPISEPQKYHSVKIATDFYFPINGDFDVRHHDFVVYPNNNEDHDPDIFKANFFGHSLTFIVDIQNGNLGTQYQPIKILDADGYHIQRFDDNTTDEHGFKIVTPDASEFYFTILQTKGFLGMTPSGLYSGSTTDVDESEHVYHLKKIVTNKNKEITFGYTETDNLQSFPIVSEKLFFGDYLGYQAHYIVHSNLNQLYGQGASPDHFWGMQDFETHQRTYSKTRGSEFYVNTINFPEGRITFDYSDRLDSNKKKLDLIKVYDIHNKNIKTCNFNYNYFDASNISTNEYPHFSLYVGNEETNYNTLRLKLENIDFGNGRKYQFNYDPTELPSKWSYATDFWGFYNGQVDDNSSLPDPNRFGYNDFSNSGNNKSARIEYAKACSLSEVIYPTGGKTVYDYELNQFDNYWVPDFANTNNATTKGLGLRVKSISKYSNNNERLLKTNYYYSGGKAALPIDYHSEFDLKWFQTENPYSWFYYENSWIDGYTWYQVQEFNKTGYFSSNVLGSHSGVGYEEVVVERIDRNDFANNGRTKYEYHNNPDIITPISDGHHQIFVQLPAMLDTSEPISGSLKKVSFFDKDNQLLQEQINNYNTIESDLFYGTKMTGAGLMVHTYNGTNVSLTSITGRTMIGFYPIFGAYSQLTTSVNKEYFDTGDKTYTTTYQYNSNNIRTNTRTTSLLNGELVYEEKVTPYSEDYYSSKYLSLPSEIEVFENGKRTKTEYEYSMYPYARLQSIKTNILGKPNTDKTLFFDGYYDDKVVEYHNKYDDKHTTVIWGYNNTYPIAKIENMTYGTIFGNLNSQLISLRNLSDLDDDTTIGYLGNEGALRQALDNFRDNPLFVDSMVTTYTYDPLVGVTSMTDPRGQTVYYEYDELNRLKHVKDKDGNILNKNEYNYANQN